MCVHKSLKIGWVHGNFRKCGLISFSGGGGLFKVNLRGVILANKYCLYSVPIVAVWAIFPDFRLNVGF